jgi:peroxiredoxin Q/BCP
MAKKTKAKKKAAPQKAKAKKAKAKKSAKKKAAPKKKSAKKKAARSGAKKTVAKKKATPQKKSGLAKKKALVKKAVAKKAVQAVLKKKAAKKSPVKKAPVKKEKKSMGAKLMDVVNTVTSAISNAVSKGSANNDSESNPNPSEEAFKKHVTSLKEGDPAPFFEGTDQNGNRVTSLDFPGKNIVLFFYPEDDTETCTIEACNLRDEYSYLQDNNYAVVGVSPDSVDSHGKFADKYSLPYPLIADTDQKIIKAYDVWGPKQLFGRKYDGLLRTTFIIGFEGNIKKIITDVDAKNHAKQITAN